MSRLLTYVEIDLPRCANTYGVLPCTASLVSSPPTGTIKCFNTRKTCQDIANYLADDPATLRFARPCDYLPAEPFCFPSIDEVSFKPAIVSLGVDLGERASVSITFSDHPDDDTAEGLDPYLAERTYDPFSQGTFFGKLRARQPFLQGVPLRLIEGELGTDIADMETRHFLIESFDGPTPAGKYTLRATDVLKLADAEKAQAPAMSEGFLVADINSAVTSFTLTPSGIGNADYPASGYLNLGGSEIVSFTRSGDVCTITRGQLNTTAASHTAGDRAQLILRYVGEDPADIVYDLCVNYIPGFDPAWIDLTAWQTETGNYNGQIYSTNICEPTSVKQLLEECVLQMALALWDDNINQLLRLQVLRPVVTDAFEFTPDNMIEGSLATKEQPEQRVSRVQVYFGQINALRPLSNVDNYRSTTVVADTDSEDDYGTPSIKTIFSRWIPQLGRTVADRLGAIVLGRYKNPPRHVAFDLQRYASTDAELGGGYHFQNMFVQDETGAQGYIPIQVTQLKPSADRFHVEAEEMLFDTPAADLANRFVTIDANNYNLNLRTVHDTLYPAPDGSETVTFTVLAGIIVGSHGAAMPAIDVGTWPAGTTINVIVLGRIQGMGGAGGTGGNISAAVPVGSTGSAGGTALYTRKAINLTYTAGALWSGGGGGGGGGRNGGGGGGGAGQDGGAGGAAPGFGASPGSAGSDTAGGAGGAASVGNGAGGAGGGTGLAGSSGGSVGSSSGGAGGAAGAAIDGVSFVTVIGGAGDLRGSTIN